MKYIFILYTLSQIHLQLSLNKDKTNVMQLKLNQDISWEERDEYIEEVKICLQRVKR